MESAEEVEKGMVIVEIFSEAYAYHMLSFPTEDLTRPCSDVPHLYTRMRTFHTIHTIKLYILS
jgi:hypothetical protein